MLWAQADALAFREAIGEDGSHIAVAERKKRHGKIARPLILALAAVLLASACGGSSDVPASSDDDALSIAPSERPADSTESRIAFRSNRTGTSEIYVIDSDGQNVRRITDDLGLEADLMWSPDGEQIAFASDRDGNYEIYVIGADGHGLLRLTDHPASDYFAGWSPDGRRIAFRSNRDDNDDIYVVNADGSGLTRLTDDPAKDVGQPWWSPDGERLLWLSERDDERDIFVMNADGSNEINLTDRAGLDTVPSWTPEGNPWSPDGERIAFVSNRDGNTEVYLMNADGSDHVNLTNNPGQDGVLGIAWSPDGERIAFSTDRDGNHEIYLMNTDGSSLLNLTMAPGDDQFPGWSPDGIESSLSPVAVACRGLRRKRGRNRTDQYHNDPIRGRLSHLVSAPLRKLDLGRSAHEVFHQFARSLHSRPVDVQPVYPTVAPLEPGGLLAG